MLNMATCREGFLWAVLAAAGFFSEQALAIPRSAASVGVAVADTGERHAGTLVPGAWPSERRLGVRDHREA